MVLNLDKSLTLFSFNKTILLLYASFSQYKVWVLFCQIWHYDLFNWNFEFHGEVLNASSFKAIVDKKGKDFIYFVSLIMTLLFKLRSKRQRFLPECLRGLLVTKFTP